MINYEMINTVHIYAVMINFSAPDGTTGASSECDGDPGDNGPGL